MVYPKELLPKPDCEFIKNVNILDCAFIRETKTDIYAQINNLHKSYNLNFDSAIDALSDFVANVVGAKTSRTEVFQMSLFLYGIFNESHVGIRETETDFSSKDWQKGQNPPDATKIRFEIKEFFPLYLSVEKLNCVKINFESSVYDMSFEHKPNLINFWHFQLFCDADNRRLYRDCGSKKYKRLAAHILETKIQKAICRRTKVKPYANAKYTIEDIGI